VVGLGEVTRGPVICRKLSIRGKPKSVWTMSMENKCLEHVRPQHVRPWKTEECPEHAHLKTSVQNVRLWKTEECPIGSTSGN
jgi:hypothetical protein